MWLTSSGKDEAPPEKYALFIDSWIKNNPDFEIIFWNNSKVKKLWKNPLFSKYVNTFDKMMLIEKCDMSRYALLYLYGGVYLDLNTTCYKNISPLIYNQKLMLSKEPKEHIEREGRFLVTNSFLASCPMNDFWLKFMNYIVKNYKHTGAKETVLENTGPAILGDFSIKNNVPLIDECIVQPYRMNEGNTQSKISKECFRTDGPYLAKRWEYTAGWGMKDREGKSVTPWVMFYMLVLAGVLYYAL